jgi:hypothetical protein
MELNELNWIELNELNWIELNWIEVNWNLYTYVWYWMILIYKLSKKAIAWDFLFNDFRKKLQI